MNDTIYLIKHTWPIGLDGLTIMPDVYYTREDAEQSAWYYAHNRSNSYMKSDAQLGHKYVVFARKIHTTSIDWKSILPDTTPQTSDTDE